MKNWSLKLGFFWGSVIAFAISATGIYAAHTHNDLISGHLSNPLQRLIEIETGRFADNLKGSGGPDGFGYVWRDSDEPGGPQFEWIELDPDLGGYGTAIVFDHYDDGTSGFLPLGEPFWFYGEIFDSIAVCTNGWASFLDPLTNYQGVIPSTTSPNAVLAPLWRDLRFYTNYSDDDSAYFWHDAENHRTVIEWREISKGGAWNLNFTFEIILDHDDNTITFQYLNATDWTSARPLTLGIESPDGTDGLSIPNAYSVLRDSFAIKFYPPPVVDTMFYDDGTPTVAWAWQEAGNGFGLKFLSPDRPRPLDIEGVFIFVPDWPQPGGNTLTVRFVDNDGQDGAPGTTLYEAANVSVERGTWNFIEISDTQLVDEDGIFYVFVIQDDDYPNCATVAVDSEPDLPDGFVWEYRNGDYTPSSSDYFEGDFMIRPVVSFSPRNIDISVLWLDVPDFAVPDDSVHLLGVFSSGGRYSMPFDAVLEVRDSVGALVHTATVNDIQPTELGDPIPVDFGYWIPTYSGTFDISVYCLVEGDANSANDTAHARMTVYGVHEGGPDDFGYTFRDSYHPEGPEYQWIEISNSGRPLGLGNDDFVRVGLSFAFPFYENFFDSVDISSNGVVTFGYGDPGGDNTSLPADSIDMIAVFWGDLDPSVHGEVFFQDFGDYAVIEWYEVPEYGEWGYNTFEVVLYPDGNIILNFKDIVRYSDETVGIQSNSGMSLTYIFDGTPFPAPSRSSVEFYRVEHEVATLEVIEPHGHLIPWTPVSVIARVMNFGRSTETFEMRAEAVDSVSGLVAWASTVLVEGLEPGEVQTVQFDGFIPGRDSVYTIRVYHTLSHDFNPSNDTAYSHANSIMHLGDVVFGPMVIDTIIGDMTPYGLIFDGQLFYLSATGDTNMLFVFDTSGAMLFAIPQGNSGLGWRDMAWQAIDTGMVNNMLDTLFVSDGRLVYKLGVDILNAELDTFGTIDGPLSFHRALAYSVWTMHLYAADLNSPIYEFDKDGLLVRVIPNPHPIEAAAWDPGYNMGDSAQPLLWFSTGEANVAGSNITIRQFDELEGTYTGVVFYGNPYFSSSETSAGLDFADDFRGFSVLFVAVQGNPDYIIGYFVRYADQTRQVYPDVDENRDVEIPTKFGVRVLNPVVEHGRPLELAVASPVSQLLELKIYDVSGRCVYRRPLKVSEGIHTYSIESPVFKKSGFYLISVRNHKGEHLTKKAIVLH